MTTYAVREVFDTFQGEGLLAGRRAVFVRFAGCNLWDGRPEHRERGKGACARWCDTSFAAGERMDAADLLRDMECCLQAPWDLARGRPLCVLTGGEPMLQVDEALLVTLRAEGWQVAMETNGTVDSPALRLVDHLCVSPKLGGELKVKAAQELKVVLPGHQIPAIGWNDKLLEQLARAGDWGTRWVVPMDPPVSYEIGDTLLHPLDRRRVPPSLEQHFADNVARCLDFVRRHPDWRIGCQQHKLWCVP